MIEVFRIKKTTSLLLVMLSVTIISAQEPCNDDIIMDVKGAWTKGTDVGIKGPQGSGITNRIDKIQQLLQAAYPNPKGAEAKWYRYMGGYYSSIDKNLDAYELNAFFFNWYCNIHVKKLLKGIEASAAFDVWANKFKWFAQADDKFQVDNKPVYLLTKRLGELNGFPVYAGNENSYRNTGTTYSKTMLISRPGQLPYTPVTRKQYLLVFLKNKEAWQKNYVESLRKMPVRSDAEEELNKRLQLEKVLALNGTNEAVREKAKANFLRGYTTAKQRRQADITRSEDVYKRDIKAATDYLNNASGDDLAKPANLENTSYQSSFRSFAKEAEGSMIVQVNSGYFNNKFPSHVPQFLIVYWHWNTEKPSLDFAAQIEKNFDFTALQAMLDK